MKSEDNFDSELRSKKSNKFMVVISQYIKIVEHAGSNYGSKSFGYVAFSRF